MNPFEDLFLEMIELAEETKSLLEPEKGTEKFKESLQYLIEEMNALLHEPTLTLTPENDEKMTQFIAALKTIFEDIADFFSTTIASIHTNQHAIQVYVQYALERF